MDKQLEPLDADAKTFQQLMEALTPFLSIPMRDLPKDAVKGMNQQVEAGTGFFRITTEVSAAGLRVATAFVTEQNIVPILDIHIGNTESEESRDDGGHPSWSLH